MTHLLFHKTPNSVSSEPGTAHEAPTKGKKSRKVTASQKEMLLLIEGEKPAAKKTAKPERSTGRRKAG
jgi:hypothetical protein